MPRPSRKPEPLDESLHTASDQKLLEVLPAFFLKEFLESDEARPVRILAEYLEPLRRFRDQQIQDTVVFFGSARVHSREAARQRLARATANGRNGTARAELARLKRAVEWSRYYEDARELARR